MISRSGWNLAKDLPFRYDGTAQAAGDRSPWKEVNKKVGLYRRGKTWWMSFIVPGKGQIRQSAKTANKKLAERIYGKMLNDIEEGRWFENQARKNTLKSMIERYEEEYSKCKSYYSKARDKTIFKTLYKYFGEEALLKDVEVMIGGYEQYRKTKGKKPIKPSTIVKEIGVLRRMFNIARKQWKWKIQNPVSEIELPKVSNERVRYLSESENSCLFEALDKAPEKWLKPCVTIAIDTGLRQSNICGLQWSEVNLLTRSIIIAADKMKNSEYIGIPLTERACQIFRELKKVRAISDHVFHDNGKMIYPVKLQRAFRQALSAAGISNFHFHDLRHTFASMLVQSGVDIYTVQKLMGHKDGRMTKRYAHLNMENLRNAVAKLEAITNLSQIYHNPRERYAEAIP